MDDQPSRPDSTREFLRTLTGVLIVLSVFYTGLLLFLISGPSMDDVDNLRTIVFWVLLLALVASGMLIFLGARMFSAGSTDEALEAERVAAEMDEEEVMLEEYLGLSNEAAQEEAEDAEAQDDSEEGHA